MRRRWKIAAAGAIALLTACAAPMFIPAMPPIDPPMPPAFDRAKVEHGATLAAIGDCAICHTAAKGKPFAGGRPLRTPFGTIHATNITPDPDTGIGRWSLAAFARAMREGIDREGRHLYPALPYQHFTRLTDQDMEALYAFLMTRAPVHADDPPNALSFPANIRATLAGWNLLFLNRTAWSPDPARSAEWNRGAYLVDALGHCGACHTPRNSLGAERDADALSGGEAEGWDAPALRATSPAGVAWTVDSLTEYLRTGFAGGHGAAAGPMTAVTDALAQVPEPELRAIAVYIQAGLPSAPPVEAPKDDPGGPMAAIFNGACGTCHGADAAVKRPSLAFSTAVNAPGPRDVVQVILRGIPSHDGVPAPFMPGFGNAFTDDQVAGLARYVRARYSRRPAWTDIERQVPLARREGGS